MDRSTLDGLHNAATVRRLREEGAMVCRRHRLTLADVRAATRRVAAQWQAVGLRCADLDPETDRDFWAAILIELRVEAQRRAEGRR